jgi:hypothetical protein
MITSYFDLFLCRDWLCQSAATLWAWNYGNQYRVFWTAMLLQHISGLETLAVAQSQYFRIPLSR